MDLQLTFPSPERGRITAAADLLPLPWSLSPVMFMLQISGAGIAPGVESMIVYSGVGGQSGGLFQDSQPLDKGLFTWYIPVVAPGIIPSGAGLT